VLSDISSITAYLLYTYAANAKTHMLGGETNLLESCFGAGSFILGEGAICGVWGLSPHARLVLALMI